MEVFGAVFFVLIIFVVIILSNAIRILREAGVELGRLAAAVIRRLGMEQETFAVVPFGGVFKARDLIVKSFAETCLASAPHAIIIYPKFEPVVGAVLIALREIGVEIDQRIIRAVEGTSRDLPALRIEEVRK